MPARTAGPMLRFYCGRKGAVLARILITIGTPVVGGLAAFAVWFALQILTEIKTNTDAVNRINVQLAGATERGNAMRATDAMIAVALGELQKKQMDMHDRIIRLEARR